MSLQIYDKTTGSLTVVAASATRTWIGSKAAHDAEALANKLPNNCLLAVLETGLYYRDSAGTETLVTAGGDSDVQAITMPTADAAHLGKVVQYIGTTNTNYTHNYWYECVSDGATPPTYTWQRTDVQPGGSSIQVSTFPTAGITELGKVYQYIGADTQDYKHGYFYECTFDGTDYAWTYLDVDEGDGNQIQYDTLPSPTVDYEGRIVQYTGATNANYTNAYFYKCVSDGQVPATYTWEQVNVQDGGGQTIQVAVLPTAAIGELGKIYQYTGATTADYTHGYFYECIYDGANYEWVNIPVQKGINIFIGTIQEWNSLSTEEKIQYDEAHIIDDNNMPTPVVKIVSWSNGTDAEIADMIAAADAGEIDLRLYWHIGDERIVHLSAMEAGDGLNIAQPAQDVVLVLMDTGSESGYKDINNKPVNFVWGQKDCLTETGKINRTNVFEGSWNGCALRADLNSKYYNALPATFRGCLKQFKVKTNDTSNSSDIQISQDYISLFAEKEIFGSSTYSGEIEANALIQINYYKTKTNRVKLINDSATRWWERSPKLQSEGEYVEHFCAVHLNGDPNFSLSSAEFGIAPFGCI